ncbi:MAG: BatD family protein [Flavobacteriales bacterium]
MNISLHIPKIKWNCIIFTVLLLSFNGLLAGGTIQGITKIEGAEFEVGEQFTVQYILQSTGQQLQGNYQISGDNFGPLNVLGQNSGNSTSIVNGSISQSITLTYYLKSTKTGVFKIPGIEFLLNGKQYPCQDKTIKIIKQRKDSGISGDLILKLKPNKTSVYVGEPIRYDLYWYSSYQAQGFQLKELPKFDGFVVKSLESKSKTKIKTINGKKYLTGKSYSFILTPIKTGTIKLPEVKGIVYLSKGFFQRAEPREISSGKLSLKVKPLPTPPNGTTEPILVGKYTLKTKLDKSELNVNDAVTIKLLISGSGNLNALSDLSIDYPSAFETLPPTVKNNVKTDLSGIHGSKTFEFVAIPRQPGKFTIPPITLSVFNPQKKEYYNLKSNAVTIQVNGAASLDANPYVSNGGQDVEIQGSDIRYINTVEKLFTEKKSDYTRSLFQYLLLAVSILTFVFGTFAFKKRLLSKSQIKSNKKAKANRVAQKHLKDAQKELNGDKNKFYELVDNALNNYLLGKLMIEQSQLKQQTITEELKKQKIKESLIQETLKVSNDCKMARFSPLVLAPNEMFTKAEKVINELENQLK